MATSAPATVVTPTTAPTTNPPSTPTTPKGNSAAPTAPDAQKRVDAIVAIAVKACNIPPKGQSPPENIAKNLPIMMKVFAEAGLTSKNQLAAMIATVYVETGSWKLDIKEDPGSVAISQPIGGDQYCGRGPIQLTHIDKYQKLTELTGQDFVANPDLLMEPNIAAKGMTLYWLGKFANEPVAPFAEKGDWANVRSCTNLGSSGGVNSCHGVPEFKAAWDILSVELPEGASPDIVGVAPGASFGVASCADGGSGSNKTIVAPGASTQSDALAYALGMHQLENQKSHTVRLLLNANAQPEILKLKAQTKFRLEGLGEPKITTPSTGTVDVKAVNLGNVVKSDPNAAQASVENNPDPIAKAQSGVSPQSAADTAKKKEAGDSTKSTVTTPATTTKPVTADVGYEGEYTIEEVAIFLEKDGWTVEIIGYKPDPNAPPPGVFRHDPTSSTDKASVTAAGKLPSNPSEINGKLLAAAKSNMGASSAAGPDGGRNACAWSMNKFVFNPGIGHSIGGDSVESVVIEFEKNGYGVAVPRDQVLAGDVVIMGDHIGWHIGIALEDKGTKILSNSSSQAAFQWVDSFDGYDAFYTQGKSRAYRVLK
jgi:predicted chitinase